MSMLIAFLLQGAAPDSTRVGPIGPPPKAAPITGEIEQVTLSPIFNRHFECSQHAADELEFAGDALGSDCVIVGGITREGGFGKLYRTDGKTNEDWYGWHQDVLAGASGMVLGVLEKPEANVPGMLGPPPAGTVRILTDDGIVLAYGHVVDMIVKGGDRVQAGQRIGRVGNNGVSRGPHIHIGAYRAKDLVPLQIRWDLRAMARIVPS